MLRNLASRYDSALRRRPLLVKMATSGVIVGASDATVQVLSGAAAYDPVRTGIMGVGYGALTFAPVLHTVTTGWKLLLPSTTLASVVFRSVVDMATGFPFNVSLSLSWQALARSKDFSPEFVTDAAPAAVRANLWPSLVAGWALWLPVGVANYRFVPVRYQVLCLNTVSFFWNCYMVWRFAGDPDGDGDSQKPPLPGAARP
mmetsp:Transcript_55002/g.144643  ORF Transcript_55002/g.144643 Transcript_55002/m.144643 type:complete len:201 (-) Transcript_55002:8-610(-)